MQYMCIAYAKTCELACDVFYASKMRCDAWCSTWKYDIYSMVGTYTFTENRKCPRIRCEQGPEPLRITTFTHVSRILTLVQNARSWLCTSSCVNIRRCPFLSIHFELSRVVASSLKITFGSPHLPTRDDMPGCKECSTQSSRIDAHTGAVGSAGACWVGVTTVSEHLLESSPVLGFTQVTSYHER